MSKKEIVSTCVLVGGNILVNGHIFPMYFLTQVVTVDKYRGSGYFKQLLGDVEKYAISKGISILIVIARRAAGDLYWKLGFKGFSHFPEVVSLVPNSIEEFNNFREARVSDIERLMNIQSNSSLNLDGMLLRTDDDWKLILETQSRGTHEVFLPLGPETEGYVIIKDRIGLELGLYKKTKFEQRFVEDLTGKLEKMFIDRNNPVFAYLSASNWKYSERFEAKEGHLIKLISKAPIDLQRFIEEVTKANGLYRFKIDPVDQW
jgi:hypothetical protein